MLHNTTKIWHIISFISVFFLVSCGNGKIIKRKEDGNWLKQCDGNSIYLVNKSNTDKYIFTIKKTEYSNKSNQEVESATFQISMYPGDEKYLGCDSVPSSMEDDGILYLNYVEYKIVGEMDAPDSATIDR